MREEPEATLERAAPDMAPAAAFRRPQAPAGPSRPLRRPEPRGPPQSGYDLRYDQGHHGHAYRPHHKRNTSWLQGIFD